MPDVVPIFGVCDKILSGQVLGANWGEEGQMVETSVFECFADMVTETRC